MNDRRDFLKKTALLGFATFAGSLIGREKIEKIHEASELLQQEHKFVLPELPYPYDALEPFIDKQTMEIHHTKHHKSYVDKLNTVAPSEIDFTASDAEKCRRINESSTPLLRNNLGGHYNHSLFWQMMKKPDGKNANKPGGAILESISSTYKSFEDFKKEFSETAGKIFGSGWCWLIRDPKNKLRIVTTPNQDNPLMAVAKDQGTPLLALDVWEHAYYLKYQNKRADYISNWWNVINWEKVNELYSGK
jgi:superoxide dismutase, Fe-Mn family